VVYTASGVTGLLQKLIARPAMSFWYASVVRRHASLPRPEDAPVGNVPGPSTVNVLMVGGDGPSVGWGVRSHGLALPGQFARELAARTGRGVHVDLISDPSFTVAEMPEVLAGRNLSAYEVILVIPGAREAITLVQPSAWERSVRDLLGLLGAAGSAQTRQVFVGSQPLRSIPAFDSPLASIAAPHRRLLNGIAEEICLSIPGASYITLPASDALNTGRYRSPDDYLLWARTLVDHVASSAISPGSVGREPRDA